MNEIMKTNPPSRLAKKLISLSEADNWEEAKNEWKMGRYYHISDHCSCLCSSKGVHDMTVIENIFNTNQMHICNSCASLYFGIQESLKIESTVVIMDFFRVFITAPISLTVLFLLAKLMGNKQMSELNMFDYINGITIGSIAAELATGEFTDIYDGVMAMVIYSLIAIMLTFLSQKSLLLRRFITGKSIIIYDNGKFYNKNLSTAKIDINEILVMCRSKGYFNFDEIQTVILESNGQLSILPKDKNRPLTPDDMKITVLQSGVEAVVIQDGKVLERNLKATGNNIEWLKKELKKQNIKTSEVFIAFCDNNNTLKVHKKVKSNPTNDIFD